jgi:hypothetical protein
MLYHNLTRKPLLEQKPLHTGYNRRETFAEPSNCSANTHCKQILQKPLKHLINIPREHGAAVNFRTLEDIVIVKAGNNNHFFCYLADFLGLLMGGVIMVIKCFLIEG